MISSSLGSRLSGLALVLGGLIMAFAVFHVPTHPPLTALIPLVGGVLLCVGIPALYLRQAHQVGWVGLVGISILWLDLVIFPVQQGVIGFLPGLKLSDALYIIGPLTVIGTLLFGIQTIRAHVFPRALGWTLFVGFIVGLLGHIMFGGSLVLFIGDPGEWLFWLSFAAFGVVLLTRRTGEEAPGEARVGTQTTLPMNG